MECIDGTQAHHWDIEASTGRISKGTCRKCKQVQRFHNSFSAISSWRHKVEQKGKNQVPNLGDKGKGDE